MPFSRAMRVKEGERGNNGPYSQTGYVVVHHRAFQPQRCGTLDPTAPVRRSFTLL